MNILITGSNGFIGKNLSLRIREERNTNLITFTKENNLNELKNKIELSDFIFHLAGVNRSNDYLDFQKGNLELTKNICKLVENVFKKTSKRIPILYSSTKQVGIDNYYGKSKLMAENELINLNSNINNKVYIMRLTNVFGKWCNINYNSVVATFCHNIARDLPIEIHDPNKSIKLIYIDDLMDKFISIIKSNKIESKSSNFISVEPEYCITLKELAEKIINFKKSRESLIIDKVGKGFARALYATYMSYLPTSSFSYSLKKHSDSRGDFVEFLKTYDSGQVSFFTAKPGIKRGGHYHNTKNEKFLILSGKAQFNFISKRTNQKFSLITDASEVKVVETIPGWIHDITNIGMTDLIVMLWSNEIFNPDKPDTYNSTNL